MYRLLLMALAFCLVANIAFARSMEDQGSTVEEVQQANLKPPATQKVAVFLFWDIAADVVKDLVPTTAAYLIMQREGYKMIPLWDAEKAMLADKLCEPGAALRREDAVRLGKTLGADLVLYGDNYWMSLAPKIKTSTRVCLIDVHSGDVVCWGRRTDKVQSGAFGSASSLERRLYCDIINYIFDPLRKALPLDHIPTQQNLVDEKDVLKLEKEWEAIKQAALGDSEK